MSQRYRFISGLILGRVHAAANFGKGRRLACLASLLTLAGTGMAQPVAIDTANSRMTIRVYKSGVFSAFGHDHEIAAPIASGTVDATAHRVELRVQAAALRVQDPNTSQKDRDQVQQTMEGSEVLDAAQYPEIVFRATSAQSAGPSSWSVRGDLTLHGQTRPVTVDAREQGGHYVGAAKLRQTDFGITPVKVAGGAVKVKDEIRVEFDIQLVH